MSPVLVSSISINSYKLGAYQYGKERLNLAKTTGQISIKERITLYVEALKLNQTSNMFCIVDNSGEFENIFSYQDMQILDDMLIKYKIRKFVGATVTSDPAYGGVVEVANVSAQESGLVCDLISTDRMSEAEAFVIGKIWESQNYPAVSTQDPKGGDTE